MDAWRGKIYLLLKFDISLVRNRFEHSKINSTADVFILNISDGYEAEVQLDHVNSKPQGERKMVRINGGSN